MALDNLLHRSQANTVAGKFRGSMKTLEGLKQPVG